jgi:hypothetical protein
MTPREHPTLLYPAAPSKYVRDCAAFFESALKAPGRVIPMQEVHNLCTALEHADKLYAADEPVPVISTKI